MKTLLQSSVFSSLALFLWSFGNQLALAQATCTVNGEEVPCEEVTKQIGGLLGFGIGIFIFIVVVGIAATVFWIMMIVHAASHQIENKAIWIILMVLTGIIGAIVYYFMVKRKFSQPIVQAPTTPTMTAPQ